jgi:hypothetical protein
MVIDVNVIPDKFTIATIAVGAAAAFGTIWVARMALVTLRRTIRDRKTELKETRAKEILEWAEEINIYALRRRPEAIEEGSNLEFINDQENELFEIYEPFRSRAVYTETIASNMDNELKISVCVLRRLLQRQIRYIYKIRRNEATEKSSAALVKVLTNNINNLHRAA